MKKSANFINATLFPQPLIQNEAFFFVVELEKPPFKLISHLLRLNKSVTLTTQGDAPPVARL
ncbi:MAG: hypothetical protein ACRCT7_12825 [Shewanella sp.]|uniref:hypothetical protein n=1 Tax=Shewanella sp. SNU WT4 TaxID=2590015 RepID=UPI001126178C|nr:hypothetical protein [Shewanella sp. SNU WT4]QDF68306.1 hypothetical protein FJQ87_17940 [Shewanella sp. SNU WT4]